mmetsp:Transcript_2063/g.4332  ORF Transcript_2063/g.4332 Transcript_2063/m.4332 type:complete len:205 (+) Transcript_2063:1191-1805(+)
MLKRRLLRHSEMLSTCPTEHSHVYNQTVMNQNIGLYLYLLLVLARSNNTACSVKGVKCCKTRTAVMINPTNHVLGKIIGVADFNNVKSKESFVMTRSKLISSNRQTPRFKNSIAHMLDTTLQIVDTNQVDVPCDMWPSFYEHFKGLSAHAVNNCFFRKASHRAHSGRVVHQTSFANSVPFRNGFCRTSFVLKLSNQHPEYEELH